MIMMRRLMIRTKEWQEMRDHVQQHVPMEACGLLAGKEDQVEKVLAVPNQAQSPMRFIMDPYEQLKAFDWIDSNGLDLLGIFHSHPTGPETVSQTDIAEAAYEVIYIVWSPMESAWQARGFWIEDGYATEVSLQIVD